MPATAQAVWAALQKARNAAPGGVKDLTETAMYNFTFHRPTTVRQAASLLAQSGGQAPGRRPHADPDDEAAAGAPSALIDLSQVEGMTGIELKGARS